MTRAVEVRDLSVVVDGREVLANVNLEVGSGEVAAITGPTGSGKSTLLKVIAGIIPKLYSLFKISGSVNVCGLSPLDAVRRGLVAYVPQDPSSYFIGSTVAEELLFVRDLSSLRRYGIIDDLLSDPSRKIHELSVGQLYRLLVAAAVGSGTKVLLLDEPTSHVDPWSLGNVLKLLREYCVKFRASAIIVDHRIELIKDYIDFTLELKGEHQGSTYIEVKGSSARGDDVLISARGLRFTYDGGYYVLNGVKLEVHSGESVAIIGRNGAGKTTLMRILYGEIKPTRGTIKVFGKKVSLKGPWDAIRLGIGMVYQHFSLVPSFTVLENLVLALSPIAKVSVANVRRKAIELIEQTGLKVPLDARVEDLAVGVQQRVEILKALLRNARILILDEPTSVLTPVEVRELFDTLKRLKELGITIVFITHKLKEVKEITDTITILRKGKVVGVVPTKKTTEIELARMMVGREVFLKISKKPSRPGREVLRIEDLWVRDDRGLLAVKGVNLVLREGEILGIAGVAGNGQRELAEAIVGLRTVEKGKVVFMGKDITNLPPSEIYRLGISYIPDSRAVGLVLELDLTYNSILTRITNFLGKSQRIIWGKARSFTSSIIQRFNVVTESLKTPTKYLSGGNQQKLLVGREVITEPKVIIASEPTHGLDVGATEYIRKLLVRLRDEGKAILLISTDLDEVLQLSDRIAVIYEGRIMAVGKPEEFTLERLGLLMGGISG